MKYVIAVLLVILIVGGAAFAFVVLNTNTNKPGDNQAIQPGPNPAGDAAKDAPVVDSAPDKAKVFYQTGELEAVKKELETYKIRLARLEEEVRSRFGSSASAEHAGSSASAPIEGESRPAAPDLSSMKEDEVVEMVRKANERIAADERKKHEEERKTEMDNRLTKIAERLNWNADTVQKVKDIIAERMQKLADLRAQMGEGGDRSAMREQMGQFFQETTEQLKAIVGEDGVNALGELLGPGGRRGGMGGGNNPRGGRNNPGGGGGSNPGGGDNQPRQPNSGGPRY
jgi:bacterioferritin-associated ferredoxin